MNKNYDQPKLAIFASYIKPHKKADDLLPSAR